MVERANRYDVLAREFCSCKHCGARYPDIDIISVEFNEKGRFRKKRQFYIIKAICTSNVHNLGDSDRDFEIKVPYKQYWSTIS
jgi:hypothetical protein